MNSLDLDKILESYLWSTNLASMEWKKQEALTQAKAQIEQYIEDRVVEARIDELERLVKTRAERASVPDDPIKNWRIVADPVYLVFVEHLDNRLKALNKEGENDV
jgi:hypothetical protein